MIAGELKLRPYTFAIHQKAIAIGSRFRIFPDDYDFGDSTRPSEVAQEMPPAAAEFETALISVALLVDPTDERPEPANMAEAMAVMDSLEIEIEDVLIHWRSIAEEILRNLATPQLPPGRTSSNPNASGQFEIAFACNYVADVAQCLPGMTESQILAEIPLWRGLTYRNIANLREGLVLT